ncbi:MAG: hypothetical protein ACOX42_06050 [Clostridia bacterium]|jgi:hypothetical protein|nr:hypothetical protein [Clostridiales bacterium]
MCDLRGRINSLRAEIMKETNRDIKKLRAERILELCKRLEKLLEEYISSNLQ